MSNYNTRLQDSNGDLQLILQNLQNKAAGGGTGTSQEDALIEGTISNYTNDRVSKIGRGCFAYNNALRVVEFPNVTTIQNQAFFNCVSMTAAIFPKCTSIGDYAFGSCNKIASISFPVVQNISSRAFYSCYALKSLYFPLATKVQQSAFYRCSSLTTITFDNLQSLADHAFASCRTLSNLTIAASSVCALAASTAFVSTPFRGYSTYFSGTPYIYVPASLVDAYKSATNWTYYSSYISAIN